MVKRIIHISNTQTTTFREEQYEGKTHIVIPVVMMVEGVHHGSMGPLLYTEDELSNFPERWNGVPVVINHPQNEKGKFISANSPAVINQEIVGRVFNATWENGKLKAEAWVSKERLEEKSPGLYARIEAGEAIDVSIGVFSDEIEEVGEWNGEKYEGIAINFLPDHLAILPEDAGACNWDDGCGIRANKSINKKGGNMTKKKGKDEVLMNSALIFIKNEGNYLDIINELHSLVNAMDSGTYYCYLEAVYEDHIIYRRSNVSGNNARPRYFKQNYTKGEDGAVAFADDPMEVKREVEYAALMDSSEEQPFKVVRKDKTNVKIKTQKSNGMTKCQKVAKLIENKGNTFTQEDSEFLNGLEESQLDKMLPLEESKEKDEGKKEEKKEVVNTTQTFDAKAAVLEALQGMKPDEVLALFPGEMSQQMKQGLKMYNNQRSALVKNITDNSDWTEEELKEWDIEKLMKLNKTIASQLEEEHADYSFAGGQFLGRVMSEEDDADEEEEIAAMTSFLDEPKKAQASM